MTATPALPAVTKEHQVAADMLATASQHLTAYAAWCYTNRIERPAAPLYDLTLLEELTVRDEVAGDVRAAMARIIAAGAGAAAPEPQAEAEWWADSTTAALRAAGYPVPDDADDMQECDGCGDHVYTLSSDGLCDGCVIHPPTDDELDVASLPDCGQDFMAGTICSLPAGHVERDGTNHAPVCRTCGVDWVLNDGCDCPPDYEIPHPEHTECADGCGLAVTHDGACLDKPGGRVVCGADQHALPEVHRLAGYENAAISTFEVTPVLVTADEASPVEAGEANAYGIYVTFADAPTMHVADYDTEDEAVRTADRLGDEHGSFYTRLPSGELRLHPDYRPHPDVPCETCRKLVMGYMACPDDKRICVDCCACHAEPNA